MQKPTLFVIWNTPDSVETYVESHGIHWNPNGILTFLGFWKGGGAMGKESFGGLGQDAHDAPQAHDAADAHDAHTTQQHYSYCLYHKLKLSLLRPSHPRRVS